MSAYVSSVDPPDLGMLPTFRRLLRLWRERVAARRLRTACSFVYTLISITIPMLIQRAIDDAIVPHDESKLWPYIAAIVGLAALRFVIDFTAATPRRESASGSKRGCGSSSTTAYLRYPRAFYDRHATGQVLSRATNDLYPSATSSAGASCRAMQSVMMICAAGTCSSS